MSAFDNESPKNDVGGKVRESAIDKYSSFWTEDTNYFNEGDNTSVNNVDENNLSYFVSDQNQSELHDFGNGGFGHQRQDYSYNSEIQTLRPSVSDDVESEALLAGLTLQAQQQQNIQNARAQVKRLQIEQDLLNLSSGGGMGSLSDPLNGGYNQPMMGGRGQYDHQQQDMTSNIGRPGYSNSGRQISLGSIANNGYSPAFTPRSLQQQFGMNHGGMPQRNIPHINVQSGGQGGGAYSGNPSPYNRVSPPSQQQSPYGQQQGQYQPQGGYANGSPSNRMQQQQMQSNNTSPRMNTPMTANFNGSVYQVQFKQCQKDYILGPTAPPSIIIGDFVIVEADRGEDMGVVTSMCSMADFVERRYLSKVSLEDEANDVGRITRLAKLFERQQLPEKYHDETNITSVAHQLSSVTYKLPMRVIDSEYRFDRKKLTVYYASDMRIDFRELVRDLFSAYRTRIWLKKVNLNHPFQPVEFAAMSLSSGVQFGNN